MRVGVLEWNVASLGGRQRTLLAFADLFVSLGHEVILYSNSTKDFLGGCHLRYLTKDHFRFQDLHRNYRKARQVPEEWQSLDVLLVPYGGYGYLQRFLPSTRVIPWVIHPEQSRSPLTTEVWTNTKTTRHRILSSDRWATSDPRIVFPPHDYSVFRESQRPWASRTWDAVAVGGLLKAKGLVEFSEIVNRLNLKGLVIGSTWDSAKDENAEVAESLADGPCKVITNIPTSQVASLLGDARCLVCLSQVESAPLIFYEGMNAGCRVMSLDVGAAREQIGAVGNVCRTIKKLETTLKEFNAVIPEGAVERGIQFDRVNVTKRVERALNGNR